MHLPETADPMEDAFKLYLYSFYSGLIGLCAINSSIADTGAK